MSRRRTPQPSRWHSLLVALRDILHLDLGVCRIAGRHAGPTAQRILCGPVLLMLWVVERGLPLHLR